MLKVLQALFGRARPAPAIQAPSEPRRLFSGGRGIDVVPFRFSAGAEPDGKRILAAATRLGRAPYFVDEQGYEREIVAATDCREDHPVAYVESRAKGPPQRVDVRFHFRISSASGIEVASELKTYNPYFGCDVRYLEWFGSIAVLIYREKHNTYVCSFALDTPAQYEAIADDWKICGARLASWGYKEERVACFSLPALEQMAPMSVEEAAAEQLLPDKKSW